MTFIEWIAALFGFACVALYIRENVWSWPTGLIQICLYTWVFFQAKLYSDFILQLINIILQIYGWYYWLARGPGEESANVAITRLTRFAGTVWLVSAAAATGAWGFAMHRYTDAAFPYWDSLIAVLSLIAQYLLARKVLENWLIWIVVDVIAVSVYLAKGLYITTGLYAVFLVMATAGWWAWRVSYRQTLRNFAAAAGSSLESPCPSPRAPVPGSLPNT